MPLIQWIMQNTGAAVVVSPPVLPIEATIYSPLFGTVVSIPMLPITGIIRSPTTSTVGPEPAPCTCMTYHQDPVCVSKDHPGKFGITMTACVCVPRKLVGQLKIIDDTCGCDHSLVAEGGAVIRDPPCPCDDGKKPRCLVLKLKTGDPSKPQPEYCP